MTEISQLSTLAVRVGAELSARPTEAPASGN